MATIITHPLVPVAAAYLIGRDKIPPRLLITACIVSIIPDLVLLLFVSVFLTAIHLATGGLAILSPSH